MTEKFDEFPEHMPAGLKELMYSEGMLFGLVVHEAPPVCEPSCLFGHTGEHHVNCIQTTGMKMFGKADKRAVAGFLMQTVSDMTGHVVALTHEPAGCACVIPAEEDSVTVGEWHLPQKQS